MALPFPIYVPLTDVPGGYVSTAIVLASAAAAVLFAAWRFVEVRNIKVAGPSDMDNAASSLLAEESGNRRVRDKGMFQKIKDISAAISEGANAFLLREYTYMAVFLVLFSIVVLVLIGAQSSWGAGGLTAVAFVTGGVTSILSGYVGMYVAVIANSRTAVRAIEGYGPAFVTSFKAGMVMGFALVGAGVIVLYILINLMHLYFKKAVTVEDAQNFREHTRAMFEAVAGYGLGGSSVALFGRVGGGIYTKAADVGADLCGKLEFDIPEDDPRNPAVIADNVGDNVGDVAGMGADLFGSFAEATCAAMVISAQSSLASSWTYMTFPILVTATGVFTCIVTSFVATNLMVVSCQAEIEPSLKRQIYVSTVLHTPVIFLICHFLLPSEFDLFATVSVDGVKADAIIKTVKNWHVFICIATGLWAGLVIGTITEYYTSHTYAPVREVAAACQTGAATNIIYGLALGFKSVIIPAFTLALTIYISFELARMYGIAMAALGILSTMSIGLAIDCYGPICDNAGGIAEMAGMGEDIRERTDALDAAGNTTAAIGKGFAIGSAALVSLALFGGFVTIVGLTEVDILQPFQFAGLLIGAMLPYWFSALTMKSVGKAALAMVEEVRRQFTEHPGILEGTEDPDYARCVGISTDASLREMLAPGALVMLTPLIVGFFVGTEMLAGVLAGALVSGVQMAISSANSGGAWDNAKKYVESGQYGGKGSDTHKAAVVGDTVGDPLKDTSGPSLNILIKLMAIISLVFASAFPKHGLLVQLFNVGKHHHN